MPFTVPLTAKSDVYLDFRYAAEKSDDADLRVEIEVTGQRHALVLARGTVTSPEADGPGFLRVKLSGVAARTRSIPVRLLARGRLGDPSKGFLLWSLDSIDVCVEDAGLTGYCASAGVAASARR